MRRMMRASVIAAFLAALAAASGCEDSPLTVGANYKLILVANPTTVSIDAGNANDLKTVQLVATVVSDTGVPQKGYLVLFSTDGGSLAHGTSGVQTDVNGNAFESLSVTKTAPATINVTATSTTLTQSVKITKTTLCPTRPVPVAQITGINGARLYQGTVGTIVTVHVIGDTSTSDPPNSVAEYDWDCGNSQTDVGTHSSFDCTYTVKAAASPYTIRLTVKDSGVDAAYTCQQTSAGASTTIQVSP